MGMYFCLPIDWLVSAVFAPIYAVLLFQYNYEINRITDVNNIIARLDRILSDRFEVHVSKDKSHITLGELSKVA